MDFISKKEWSGRQVARTSSPGLNLEVVRNMIFPAGLAAEAVAIKELQF
jgi:hypothetical protein